MGLGVGLKVRVRNKVRAHSGSRVWLRRGLEKGEPFHELKSLGMDGMRRGSLRWRLFLLLTLLEGRIMIGLIDRDSQKYKQRYGGCLALPSVVLCYVCCVMFVLTCLDLDLSCLEEACNPIPDLAVVQ